MQEAASGGERMAEFLSMGGYAAFVWSSYGVTAVVLGALIWHSLRMMRRTEREVELLRAAKDGRRARAAGAVNQPRTEGA